MLFLSFPILSFSNARHLNRNVLLKQWLVLKIKQAWPQWFMKLSSSVMLNWNEAVGFRSFACSYCFPRDIMHLNKLPETNAESIFHCSHNDLGLYFRAFWRSKNTCNYVWNRDTQIYLFYWQTHDKFLSGGGKNQDTGVYPIQLESRI